MKLHERPYGDGCPDRSQVFLRRFIVVSIDTDHRSEGFTLGDDVAHRVGGREGELLCLGTGRYDFFHCQAGLRVFLVGVSTGLGFSYISMFFI